MPISSIHPLAAAEFSSLIMNALQCQLSGIPSDDQEDDQENNLPPPPSPNPPNLPPPFHPNRPMPIVPVPHFPSKARQSHSNMKRALKRKNKVIKEGHIAKNRAIERIGRAHQVVRAIDFDGLPIAYGGYTAIHSKDKGPHWNKTYTPDDLKDLGLHILPWNGR